MYKYSEPEIIPMIIPVTEHFESVDKVLLMKLMSIQTTTTSENLQDEFLEYIDDWILENIKGAVVEIGIYGDLYITKGDANIYPAIVSHVDIVHSYNPDLKIVDAGDLIIGLDMSTGEQHGIGADPKNGVYFALEMLKKLDIVKVALFKNEERGAINSSKADLSFFKNCSFIVQLDRRSFTNDFIDYTNGVDVISNDFRRAVKPIIEKYNYKFNSGTFTDVGALVKSGVGICGFNFSNGSINEHMDNEVCSVPHLLNAINGAYEIIIKLGYDKKWPHSVKPVKYKSKHYLDESDTGWGGWDDWGFPEESTDKTHYHYSQSWDFTREDELWIKQCTNIGECPVCNDKVIDLPDGACACVRCDSIYYIPEGKTVIQEQSELEELLKEGIES